MLGNLLQFDCEASSAIATNVEILIASRTVMNITKSFGKFPGSGMHFVFLIRLFRCKIGTTTRFLLSQTS
jgi:hypothetical protein